MTGQPSAVRPRSENPSATLLLVPPEPEPQRHVAARPRRGCCAREGGGEEVGHEYEPHGKGTGSCPYPLDDPPGHAGGLADGAGELRVFVDRRRLLALLAAAQLHRH